MLNASPYQVDVLLLDQPQIGPSFMDDIIRPMLIVAELHMPGHGST